MTATSEAVTAVEMVREACDVIRLALEDSAISPCGDRVLAVMVEEDQRTSSGLYMAADVKQFRAVVLAVGPKVKGVKANDVVVLGSHVGQVIEHSGVEVRLIVEKDLLGVLVIEGENESPLL